MSVHVSTQSANQNAGGFRTLRCEVFGNARLLSRYSAPPWSYTSPRQDGAAPGSVGLLLPGTGRVLGVG